MKKGAVCVCMYACRGGHGVKVILFYLEKCTKDISVLVTVNDVTILTQTSFAYFKELHQIFAILKKI